MKPKNFPARKLRRQLRAQGKLYETEYTPETWGGMGINFGATFNLAHNLGQMLHLRPQNKLRGVEGVFLAGGFRGA